MTMLERLLNILLTEMIVEEKESIRNDFTACLCMRSMPNVDPDELDSSKTVIRSEDDRRYYVGVTMKNGTRLTVPFDKRHFNKRFSLMRKYS